MFALLVSAILIVFIFLQLSPKLTELYDNTSRDGKNPWIISGSDLKTRMGRANTTTAGSLVIEQLQAGIEDRALVTRRVRFKAQDYPFLQATIANLHPGLVTYFIWRTADQPEQIHYQRLHYGLMNTRTQLLVENEQWQGTITEVGLDMYGDLRLTPAIVEQLKLLPPGPRPFLSSILSEWTTFTGWKNSSINKYRGVSNEKQLHPVPTLALLIATAAILLLAFKRYSKPFNWASLVTLVLIPWLILDTIWQIELSQQVSETNYLFAGKSVDDKNAADVDGELFLHIKRLKNDVLRDSEAKILLLHRSNNDDFNKLRAYFHLLPRNTYPFGQVPKKEKISGGEFIITLGTLDRLTYHQQSQSLRWKKWGKYPQCISAQEIDNSKLGKVYRVSETPHTCSAY